MQSDASSVCNGLSAAIYDDEGDSDESTWSISASLNSISALTDMRDGQTYAIAKLTDGNCWMIENLRLADTHIEGGNVVVTTLTTANTNNPLNDGDTTTPTVILKHNYTDTQTFTNLSSTSDDWCNVANSATCHNQSKLRTDNTTDRVSYTTTSTMSNSDSFYSYGNYYNWYSATAGNGLFSTGDDGFTEGDICPFGWHLPSGIGSGEYGLLSNSLGGYKDASNVAQKMTSSTTPTAAIMRKRFRQFPNNLLYSGKVSGSVIQRGGRGDYWSSTAKSVTMVYSLILDSYYAIPGTDGTGKQFGAAVRCIASPST